MAGLPGNSAIVGVGPPLSRIGPSSGSRELFGEPTRSKLTPLAKPVAPSDLPMRLCSREVKAPRTSGAQSETLPATMLSVACIHDGGHPSDEAWLTMPPPLPLAPLITP